MNLFDILPENLFSILSSPNKRIYINALFVIKECFSQEMALPKDEVAISITSKMEDELLQMQNEEIEEKVDNSLTERAYFILRRLKWAGWIETEIQDSNFREDIIIPDYAIDILNLLYALTHKKNLEYNSYAYATYSALRVALMEKERSQLYNATLSAYENSINLINSLKSLHHNLGRYYRQITNLQEINSILEEHFNNYKEYVDRIYHPLKTEDPVNMYKIPIRKMIDRMIGEDETFEELLEQAMKSGNYKDKEGAKTDILQKLFEIQDIYENIGKNVKMVDNKNSEYITATTRKVGYLLTSDKELKGKLIHILKNAQDEKVIELMADNVGIYQQRYMDKDSIYLRSSKSDKKQGTPQAVENIEVETEEELKSFIEKVGKSYTSKRVREYMEKIMQNKPIVTTNDINLESDEDFILLMLGTMGEERSFYNIEYTDKYVKKGIYKIPEMIIKRKEKD